MAIGVGVLGFVWASPPTDNAIVMLIVLASVLGSPVLFTPLSRRLLRA